MRNADLTLERAKKAELAAQVARGRAITARWNLDVVVFLFAILMTIVILLFEGYGTEIVAPIGFFGLAMVWLIGQRRGKQLYHLFYQEELAKLEDFDEIQIAQEEAVKEKVNPET